MEAHPRSAKSAPRAAARAARGQITDATVCGAAGHRPPATHRGVVAPSRSPRARGLEWDGGRASRRGGGTAVTWPGSQPGRLVAVALARGRRRWGRWSIVSFACLPLERRCAVGMPSPRRRSHAYGERARTCATAASVCAEFLGPPGAVTRPSPAWPPCLSSVAPRTRKTLAEARRAASAVRASATLRPDGCRARPKRPKARAYSCACSGQQPAASGRAVPATALLRPADAPELPVLGLCLTPDVCPVQCPDTQHANDKGQ